MIISGVFDTATNCVMKCHEIIIHYDCTNMLIRGQLPVYSENRRVAVLSRC